MANAPDTPVTTAPTWRSRWSRAALISAVLTVWITVWHDYNRGPDGYFFTTMGLMSLIVAFLLGTVFIWAINRFILERPARGKNAED